jgi:cobalt-zinc-cadmium efflux system outer membrane protein
VDISTRGRTVALALVAALSLGTPVAGQEPRRVSLEEALRLFARNNLDLRVARAEAAEAAGLERQAGAYPNPAVAGTWEPLSSDGERTSERYLNLSQRLEWPSMRGARRDAAERTAGAARARLAADSARLAFQVKGAYVDALRAEEELRLVGRAAEVFRSGESRAQARLAAGDLSAYDHRRIAFERFRYESLLADAELEAAAARRALALLVVPTSDELELAPADPLPGAPPPPDLEGAPGVMPSRRHEVAAAEAAVDAARAASAATRGERIPEVTATGGYKTQSDGFSGAFLGVSLPLPLWDRGGGAVEAADARVVAAEARLALVRRQVANDVQRALTAYRSLARRVERLPAPTPAGAPDLLEVAQVAWEEGEVELIALLDAAEAVREARITEARLRADLWIAWYDLERAVGGSAAPAPGEGR